MALTAWVPLPLAKISTATGAVPTTTPATIESVLLPDTSSEMYLGLLDFGAMGLDHFFGNVTGGECWAEGVYCFQSKAPASGPSS